MDELSQMTERVVTPERARDELGQILQHASNHLDELEQMMPGASNHLVLPRPATRNLEGLDSRPRSVGGASIQVRVTGLERDFISTPSRGGDARNRAEHRRAALSNQAARSPLNHGSARLSAPNPLHLISVRPGPTRHRFSHFTPMPDGPDPEHDALVKHLRGTVDEIDANRDQMFKEVLVRETRSKALKSIEKVEEDWKKNGRDFAKLENKIREYERLKNVKEGPYEEMGNELKVQKEKAPGVFANLRDFKRGVDYLNEVKEKYGGFEGFEKMVEAANHWKELWEEAVKKAARWSKTE